MKTKFFSVFLVMASDAFGSNAIAQGMDVPTIKPTWLLQV